MRKNVAGTATEARMRCSLRLPQARDVVGLVLARLSERTALGLVRPPASTALPLARLSASTALALARPSERTVLDLAHLSMTMTIALARLSMKMATALVGPLLTVRVIARDHDRALMRALRARVIRANACALCIFALLDLRLCDSVR